MQEEPIGAVTEVGKYSLQRIAEDYPALGLLIVLLIVALGLMVYAYIKLTRRLEAKNEKLYEEAKADFQLVLAFEKKLDSCLTGGKLIAKDITELKNSLRDIKTFIEYLKK